MENPMLKSALPALALITLSSLPAFSHATFEVPTATQETSYKAVVRIGHGCKGEATQTVRITVPEGIIAAKPMPKAGWTLKTTTGDYAKTYTLYGKPVSKGVKEIIWSGGSLPDDQYDEFTFTARITDSLPANETVYVPVVQECATGKEAWVEIPAKGQDAHSLPYPAPGIKILAQAKMEGGHHHGGHAATTGIKAGDLVITPPWSRATPAGAKVAGGFMTITNNGKTADRLIGGSAELANVFEVHEMSMKDGVMQMRALDKGLEIKPGETVELKPGGYHIMFIDIKKPFAEGEKVKGFLTFERAGRVEVEFKVESRGATGAKDEHKH
jgi:periplasmic copper chaperone A